MFGDRGIAEGVVSRTYPRILQALSGRQSGLGVFLHHLCTKADGWFFGDRNLLDMRLGLKRRARAA